MLSDQMTFWRALAEAAKPGWNGAQISVGHNPKHALPVCDYLEQCNPAAVLSLLDENERLRVALAFYAGPHDRPNDGPWGVNSRDFGDIARAALEPRA